MKIKKIISVVLLIALVSGMLWSGLVTSYAAETVKEAFDALDTEKWDVTVGGGTTAAIEDGRLKVENASYGSIVSFKQKLTNYRVTFEMESTGAGWAGIVLNKPGIADTYGAGGMLLYFTDGTIESLFNGAGVSVIDGASNGNGRAWVSPPKDKKVTYKIEVKDGTARIYFAYPGSTDLETLQVEYDKVALSEGYFGFAGDSTTFYIDNVTVEPLEGVAANTGVNNTVAPINGLDSNKWDVVLTDGSEAVMEGQVIKISGAKFPSIISLKESYGKEYELTFDMKKVDAAGWAGIVLGKPSVSGTFTEGGFLLYLQPGVMDTLMNGAPAYPSVGGTDVDPNSPLRAWTRTNHTNSNITYKLVVKDNSVSVYYYCNDIPFDEAGNNIKVLRAKYEELDIKEGYIGFGIEGAPTVYLSNVSVGPVTADVSDTAAEVGGTAVEAEVTKAAENNPKTSDAGVVIFGLSALVGILGIGGLSIRRNRR